MVNSILFSGFLEKNIILCILKGEMPFKMHKLLFFPEKYLCVPTLPKFFRPVTLNTLIFFIWPNQKVKTRATKWSQSEYDQKVNRRRTEEVSE